MIFAGPTEYGFEVHAQAAEAGALAGEWSASPGDAAGVPARSPGRRGSRVSLNRSPAAAASESGGLLRIAFHSPELVGQRWPCLTISSSGESYRTTLSGYLPAESGPAVSAHRASRAQIAILASSAGADHADGFSVRRNALSGTSLTNNGWASAESRSRRTSQADRRGRIIFHRAHHRWRVVASGSSPCATGCSIPAAVAEVLAI